MRGTKLEVDGVIRFENVPIVTPSGEVLVGMRERERERECVCVCVRESERERERERMERVP